jgi:AraC-like DNA-binding protein
MNFIDYLTRLRIEHSKQILRNPHPRISEIAFEIGFNSLPHFNRSFKRITGLTPTEFRKDTV